MTFEEVICQMELLVDLELNSIRPGAEITICKVDREVKRVLLITSKGLKKSRPFSDFQRIWDTLCLDGVAHVDSVFGGSGSSRNQPETVIACMPQIEWLYLEGKKHLVMMPENTHPLGQLRKMDEVAVEDLKLKLAENNIQKSVNNNSLKIHTVIISKDINGHSEILERQVGVTPNPLEQGVYEFINGASKATLVSEGVAPKDISVGTYVVFSGEPVITSPYKIVRFGGERYILQNLNGLSALYLG